MEEFSRQINGFIQRARGKDRRRSQGIFATLGLLCIALFTYIGFAHSDGASYSNWEFDYTLLLNEDSSVIPDTRLEYQSQLSDASILESPLVQLYMKANQIRNPRVNDSHSLVYDTIFNQYNASTVVSLPFEDRCDLYFSTLFQLDPEWNLDPLDKNISLNDKSISLDFRTYSRIYTSVTAQKLAIDLGIKPVELSPEAIAAAVKDSFDSLWNENMLNEQNLVNHLSHMRIYNKCYLSNENTLNHEVTKRFVNKQQRIGAAFDDYEDVSQAKDVSDLRESFSFAETQIKSCATLESRIYKWLSRSVPTYRRWDGEVLHALPRMATYVSGGRESQLVSSPRNATIHNGRSSQKVKSKLTNDNKSCFLSNMKKGMNGRGIVMYVSNDNAEEARHLISLLRATDNVYPIQIVYNSDLLDKQFIAKLTESARQEMTSFPHSFESVVDQFSRSYRKSGPPVQELWFVDIKSAIHEKYRDKLFGVDQGEDDSNVKFVKFLAALFNSFEEFVYLDTKTIPLKTPEYFFNSEMYMDTGVHFYKGKVDNRRRSLSDIRFFEKIMPSVIDNFVFGFELPQSSGFMDSEYVSGQLYHYMDDGLVVMDKNIHLASILTMIHMGLFSPVTSRVPSEKELWWLSVLVSGDMEAPLGLNEHFAAGVGKETPNYPAYAREICAAHTGHVNELQDSLEWIHGSGFQFCSEKINMEEEYETKVRRFPFIKSIEEFTEYYSGAIEIKHGILPPFSLLRHMNFLQEPDYGWVNEGYCNGKLWCSYSSIGAQAAHGLAENLLEGTFIEFQQSDVDLWKYYGDMWSI